MKRGVLFFACLFLLSLAISVPAIADAETENLVSIVIESFDNPTESMWTVAGSKFVTEGYPKVASADAWPEALFGDNESGADLKVLAVQAMFDRKGYNNLEFIPVREQDGELVHNPIPIRGTAKQLDLWAWGSLYNYYLEVHISDYKGVTHVLELGDLNFRGWKNLRITIPNYIPQNQLYIPFEKGLELEKIVLWTRPDEDVSGFNFFLDQIKVLTDDFVSRFDGDELVDPDRLDEIFGDE